MTSHPIAEVSLPHQASGGNKLEILRETGDGADWHNRYVQHPETKVLPHFT